MSPSSSSTSSAPGSGGTAALNLVVLHGVASAPAEVRTLPSGRSLATLAVRVPGAGTEAKATSVPTAIWDPPRWVASIETDDAVVVVGTLRRRFFRDGRGMTASRVEVEVTTIGRGGDRRRRTAAHRRATHLLDRLA